MPEVPERVEVSLLLASEILEALRLVRVYALKDSHPEELGPDFKPLKWDGYEKAFADGAMALRDRLFAEIRPQVPER